MIGYEWNDCDRMLTGQEMPDLFFAPDEKQTLNSNAREKECLISGDRPIVPARKRIISRKAYFVPISSSISPGSSSPHPEKASLQHSLLEGNHQGILCLKMSDSIDSSS